MLRKLPNALKPITKPYSLFRPLVASTHQNRFFHSSLPAAMPCLSGDQWDQFYEKSRAESDKLDTLKKTIKQQEIDLCDARTVIEKLNKHVSYGQNPCRFKT